MTEALSQGGRTLKSKRKRIYKHNIVALTDPSCVHYRSGIFVHVRRNFNLLREYSSKSTVTNFTKIGPVGDTLLHMGSYNELHL